MAEELNMNFSSVFTREYTTVKPLYSEQSLDPKKCSLYEGVHPRGVRYVHAHVPEIQCTGCTHVYQN